METPTKLAIGAAVLALLLLLGSRGRAQSRARAVTRGLVVGDSIMAHGGAVNELKRRVGGQWTNVAVVGANSAAVLRQARQNLTRQGFYSHVVVLAGINDGDRPASFTKTNLTQIYQLAKSVGAQVIAITETPFRAYSSWTNGAQTRQNGAVGFLITQRGGGYVDRVVDAHTQFSDPARPGYLDPRYAAPDGLHLDSNGQRFLGALIAQAIQR